MPQTGLLVHVLAPRLDCKSTACEVCKRCHVVLGGLYGAAKKWLNAAAFMPSSLASAAK
jgi:hypothetical protein